MDSTGFMRKTFLPTRTGSSNLASRREAKQQEQDPVPAEKQDQKLSNSNKKAMNALKAMKRAAGFLYYGWERD